MRKVTSLSNRTRGTFFKIVLVSRTRITDNLMNVFNGATSPRVFSCIFVLVLDNIRCVAREKRRYSTIIPTE